MNSRIENLAAAVVGTGFIGPVHVEGLRRAGVHVCVKVEDRAYDGFLESRLLASRQSYIFLGDYNSAAGGCHMTGLYAGVDLGGTTIKVAIAAADGDILAQDQVSTNSHLGPTQERATGATGTPILRFSVECRGFRETV